MFSLKATIAERKGMFSDEGAKFQEDCLNTVGLVKFSPAHKMIGSLVTAINNNQISVSEATKKFNAALSN